MQKYCIKINYYYYAKYYNNITINFCITTYYTEFLYDNFKNSLKLFYFWIFGGIGAYIIGLILFSLLCNPFIPITKPRYSKLSIKFYRLGHGLPAGNRVLAGGGNFKLCFLGHYKGRLWFVSWLILEKK